jgi:two-component system, LuxR family, response regulator FixJ
MCEDRGSTVAVIDDDPAVLESLRFLLEVEGHRVVTYASAAEFLRSQAVRPCCLILDHHMPQMTGLELAAHLRSERAGIPVLLITGSPSPAIITRATELGVQKVLDKPPEDDELLQFVELHCGPSRSALSRSNHGSKSGAGLSRSAGDV